LESKEEKNRKVKRERTMGGCCYFVWPLPFNLSDLVGPTRSIKLQPALLSSSIRYAIPQPRKGDSTRGRNQCISVRACFWWFDFFLVCR